MADTLSAIAAREYREERDRAEAARRKPAAKPRPIPAGTTQTAGPREDVALPNAAPTGPSSGPTPPKLFPVEGWDDITFDLNEEYLIDGIMPKRGVGLIYGASQTFKSFIAIHAALRIAQGAEWAGRKTEKVDVAYIAAEGAAGIRKRREGYVRTGRAPAKGVNFTLIPAAPNLGTAEGDYERLVATIEAAGIKPGFIALDTVAKVIGGADENGAGMAALLVNAQKLAQHFDCFVLLVHHIGHDDTKQDRPRGWSGLSAALDVQLLSERVKGAMTATVTVQKLKDEPSGETFTAHLEKVILGVSSTGHEVSTLVVDDIEKADTRAPAAAKAASVPRSKRLMHDCIFAAIDEAGEQVRSYSDGPMVHAVDAERVRERYYAAIAEKADANEEPEKVAARKRQAFNRAVNSLLDAKDIMAREIGGRRMLWLSH